MWFNEFVRKMGKAEQDLVLEVIFCNRIFQVIFQRIEGPMGDYLFFLNLPLIITPNLLHVFQ